MPGHEVAMIDFGYSVFFTPPPEGKEKTEDWVAANRYFRSVRIGSEEGFSESNVLATLLRDLTLINNR